MRVAGVDIGTTHFAYVIIDAVAGRSVVCAHDVIALKKDKKDTVTDMCRRLFNIKALHHIHACAIEQQLAGSRRNWAIAHALMGFLCGRGARVRFASAKCKFLPFKKLMIPPKEKLTYAQRKGFCVVLAMALCDHYKLIIKWGDTQKKDDVADAMLYALAECINMRLVASPGASLISI